MREAHWHLIYTLKPLTMPKYIDDLNRMIDSSSVAVLSGLSRVLFMQVNDFKARIATFIASVCFGLLVGIITGNMKQLDGFTDLVVAIAALAAKEIIDYMSARMRNPVKFFSELRGNKPFKEDDKPEPH